MGFGSRIKSIFSESTPIAFAGGGTEQGEIVAYDKNALGMYALFLSFPHQLGVTKKTGYVFESDDFLPNPEVINWKTFYGIVICWKDSTGKDDVRPEMFKAYQEAVRNLKSELDLKKRVNDEQYREMELKHTSKARKESKFEDAESYAELKKLLTPSEENNRKPGSNLFSDIDN